MRRRWGEAKEKTEKRGEEKRMNISMRDKEFLNYHYDYHSSCPMIASEKKRKQNMRRWDLEQVIKAPGIGITGEEKKEEMSVRKREDAKDAVGVCVCLFRCLLVLIHLTPASVIFSSFLFFALSLPSFYLLSDENDHQHDVLSSLFQFSYLKYCWKKLLSRNWEEPTWRTGVKNQKERTE